MPFLLGCVLGLALRWRPACAGGLKVVCWTLGLWIRDGKEMEKKWKRDGKEMEQEKQLERYEKRCISLKISHKISVLKK